MPIARRAPEPYPPDASHVDAWLAAFLRPASTKWHTRREAGPQSHGALRSQPGCRKESPSHVLGWRALGSREGPRHQVKAAREPEPAPALARGHADPVPRDRPRRPGRVDRGRDLPSLSLIHISEPT